MLRSDPVVADKDRGGLVLGTVDVHFEEMPGRVCPLQFKSSLNSGGWER